MAQSGLDRRAEETEEPSNSRLSDMTQRGQERRAEETEEQRNSRLAVMAQRGQRRRAEETDEQRNSRLSAMLQHARERRLKVIEVQNNHQIQTFYAAGTVLYPIVEEHNCGEMDNLCLKCGGCVSCNSVPLRSLGISRLRICSTGTPTFNLGLSEGAHDNSKMLKSSTEYDAPRKCPLPYPQMDIL
ncbi:hypothetical protein AVEN_198322-1 [Araneus ventricosus]|uniref:STPR domain-containing protein n=1 Tax=Araneus ventricosus TaxID=182803 RepID=A0A4Y2JW35_ARAVE|nr:hypothetical protein AVEN_198322-1 [Araneus ventricosus]